MPNAQQAPKPKPFELVAELIGHKSDVRAVKFPDGGTVLTASRDGHVRIWTVEHPPNHEDQVNGAAKFWTRILRRGPSYINSILWMGPVGHEFPEGMVASGDSDGVLEMYPPSAGPAESPTRMLIGHSRNVCTLDAATDRAWIVSGGWDGQARLWRMANLDKPEELEAGGNSIWAVLALDIETAAIGGTDKIIYLFDVKNPSVGQPHRASATIVVPDIVRSLCRVSYKHGSGAVMACAANDFCIYLYARDGRVVGTLIGHQSYVYTVASIPSTGELVSVSEDRSLRIWRGQQCIQTIIHPAVSVWSVGVCIRNGDLVTGSSDSIARIWSRDESRIAPVGVREGYLASVKMAAIPHHTVEQIDRSSLPGPDYLLRQRGIDEGHVQMINEEDGTVTAHQWSDSQGWVSVGVVMDPTNPLAGKTEFEGATYDFVFNVDINEKSVPLKLPYNKSDNPYEVAAQFIAKNSLPATYLDEVVDFIIKSSGGTPVKKGVADEEQKPFKSFAIPRKDYVVVITTDHDKPINKIIVTNKALITDRFPVIALSHEELMALDSLRDILDEVPPAKEVITKDHIDVMISMITLWPPVDRVAGLDLLRLTAGFSPRVAGYSHPRHGRLLQLVANFATHFDNPAEPDSAFVPRLMMAVRTAGNLFGTEAGLKSVMQDIDLITDLVLQIKNRKRVHPPRPNADRAAATVLLNFAVNALRNKTKASEPTTSEAARKALMDLTLEFIPTVNDDESLFRSLVAVGTFILAGVVSDKYSVFEIDRMITSAGAMPCAAEDRVKNVWEDLLDLNWRQLPSRKPNKP